MNYRIMPMAPEYIVSFREASDAVFRESQMYGFFEAPSVEEVMRFVQVIMKNKDLQFVALVDERVIGWCDVLAKPRPAMRHSGVLGIGVLRNYRGKGVGTALLQATLAAAHARGLTRIELFVRADNDGAKRLYEKVGFTIEGRLRNHMRRGDIYRDSYVMSLLYDEKETTSRDASRMDSDRP